MFAAADQTHFSLTLEGRPHDFQVLGLQGRERISRPFAFDLELVSERSNLDLDALLHTPAFLQLAADGSGIHGQIQRIAQGDRGRRLSHYQITLGPRLAYLGQRINQRIFQHLSVPQIIARVLEEHGILGNDYHFHLAGPYPEREYCVQYDESDLRFIQRLCEEEGLHYHFQHSRDGHRLVFGEDQTVFRKLAPVAYRQDSGLVASEPVIKRFELRLEARPSRTTRRDYDFGKTAPADAGRRPNRKSQKPSRTLKTTPTPDASPTASAASIWPGAPWNGTAATTARPAATATSQACAAGISCP
ncbi:type VI secretion system Vgr family protein [Pseudomonas sp. St29]|nr:type VI secretion system Vgr family protein [Pseudomonas sp. St29]